MAAALDLLFSLTAFTAVALFAAIRARRRPPGSRMSRVPVLILVAYGFASSYIIPYGLSRVLVAGYSVLPASGPTDGVTAIVVLGAGSSGVRGWDGRYIPIRNPSAASRVLEARRVYGMYPDAWIFSLGGPPSRDPSVPTSAEATKQGLIDLGVPASRILVQADAADTHDEARLVKPLLLQLNPARVVLVTSDLHMRRAMGVFRAAGLTAIPAISRDPFLPITWGRWALPSPAGLSFSGALAHELAGLGYYAARGWWK